MESLQLLMFVIAYSRLKIHSKQRVMPKKIREMYAVKDDFTLPKKKKKMAELYN